MTIVFVDLAGSTSLQEHMDPESVRRVMERFYATMRAEIEAANGLVVKFTGDGVMAGFGIREAREDDALRAIRAAVAMQASFQRFAQEIKQSRGAEVALRVGVNTGEVVVSEADDDVVGDVVNVAARLEHAAGDGNVLVGPDTWRLTRHLVTFEAVARLELKGKAEPVPAYRVVSLQLPTEEEVDAPFVGRDAELGRLREVFERCVSSTSPAIVTIIGSPGLGKTRLAGELVSSVSVRATVLQARCDATGTGTYAPIAEAFREAANIPETAGDAEVVRAIEACLPQDFSEREHVGKLVASILGVGDPATPQETFWAVRRSLEGMAEAGPVVLVVDDVQWAEPMLLDLLDHVVEWAKGAAIMIIALARPEIREARPSLMDAGSIVLEGLDPNDTAVLARGLLGAHDLPTALVRRILATTEGNPLFVRELLRMLVDDGVLSRDGERWVVTVDAEEIDVPPTINALLSARIERLRDHERAVVERASVVGQEFYRGAVLELVPPPVRSGIDAHLETLRRKELVEPEGSYWIDERVFRFHHVLIRDAAYRRLLKEARADLHERFADWLEAKVGELIGEHDEVLGYHLEQAHTYLKELGPLEEHAVELGRRASMHLVSAARRALDRDDLAAAANLSGRALSLTDDDGVRASVLLDRCESLLAMGDVDAAAEALGELRSRALDDRLRAWADCFDGQLAILTDPARLRETAVLVEGAAQRLEALKDSAGAAKGHAVHAQALAHLGQFGACEAALDRALAAARAAGDRRRANAVLASAPLAALWGPSPVPRASGRCLDVVRVLRITAGAPAVEATALRCQAVLEAMRGRSDAAHRMLASARSTLEELGLRHALVECDLFAGLIDLLSGDATSAEVCLTSAYEGFRTLNVATDAAQAAALLARSLVEQRRDDEALELTEESERHGGDDLKTAIAWRTVRARILATRGETESAIELARAAVALAEGTDALIDLADARLALSEVLAASGLDDEAQAEARAGADLYARKDAALNAFQPEVQPPTASEPERPDGRVGGVCAAPGVSADAVVTLLDRYRRALLGRDWPGMTQLYTDDHVMADHRSGLRAELSGRGAWIDALQQTWKDTESEWDFEVLGAWPERLYLVRVGSWGPAWERSYLLLVALDEGGALATRTEIFDEKDHVSAIVRLDELAGRSTSVGGFVLHHFDRHANQDWDALRKLWAPNVTIVDHRPVGWGTLHGIERGIEVLKQGAETASMTPDGLWVTEWLAINAEAALFRYRWAGTSRDGVEFGWDRLLLMRIEDGLLVRADMFDPDQADEALRLIAGEPTTTTEWERSTAMWEAAADTGDTEAMVAMLAKRSKFVAASERWRDAFIAGDRDAMAALYSPDYRSTEHVHHLGLDLGSHLGEMSEFASRQDSAVSIEVITFLGERHGVTLNVFSTGAEPDGAGSSEIVAAVAGRVDAGGRFVVSDVFAPEQLHRALIRGEELYLEDEATGKAAAGARRRRRLWRMIDAHNESDFEELSRSFAPDVSFIDRRQLGWGAVEGREAVMDVFRAVRYRSREHEWSITDVHAVADDGCVYTHPFEGVDQDGGRYEGGRVVVATLSDEGVTRLELFALGEVEEAVRRFEELRAERSGPVRAVGEWFEVFRGRLLAGGHEGYAALCAEDFVSDDRRPTLRARVTGRQVMVDSFAHVKDLRQMRLEHEVIATRGDRLELRWTRYVGEDTEGSSFDVSLMVVNELGDDGLLKEWVGFEVDDLPLALAELDERYAATLPSRQAEVIRALSEHMAMYNSHNWTGYASTFADDVRVVDHRPAGWGEVSGIDQFMHHIRTLIGLLPDASVARSSVDRVADDGVVATVGVKGTDTNGGLVEFAYHAVIMFRAGKISVFELFPVDEGRAARALFEELTLAAPNPSTDRLANDYTRMYDDWLAAIRRGDWDTAAALQAPDIVLEDRRPGIQHRLVGRDELLRSQREAVKLDYGLGDIEVVATRGDRLALHRIVWALPDDSEIEMLVLGEMDEQGRMCTSIVFGPDDLPSAHAEIDRRYLATLDGAQAEVVRFTAAVTDAYNTRDWDRFFACFASDVAAVDHRPAGWGRVEGRDDLAALVRGLADLIPDVSLFGVAVDAVTGDGLVTTTRVAGTEAHGGAVELSYVTMLFLREGKIVNYEIFPVDQLEAAVACLRQLSRPTTTAERTWSRLMTAFNMRDADMLRELYSPDCQLRDHVYHVERDGEEALASFGAFIASTDGEFRPGWALYLGDRHGVGEMTWTGKAGASSESEVVQTNVVRCDAEGRYILTESFARSETIHALVLAEELYLEDEAAGDEAAWSRDRLRLWRSLIAFNEGDVAPFREYLRPGIVTIDHRPASIGELHGRDAWLAWLEELSDVVPDRRFNVRSVRRERHVVLLDWLTTGTHRDGGSVEIPLLIVSCVGGDRQEFFSPEQCEQAERRFRELAEQPRTHIERTWDRLMAALNDRDVGVLRELHAPGFRQRQVHWHVEVDLDKIIDSLDEVFAPPMRTRRGRSFVLGERHGLMEMVVARPEGRTLGAAENVSWIVFRFDGAGKIALTEVFSSESDFLLALERLEDLYLEDEAAGAEAEASRHRLNLWRAFIADRDGDWETWASLVDPDFVQVDHRPGGFGVVDRQRLMDRQKAMGPLTSERKMTVTSITIDGDAVLLEMTGQGTNQEGGSYEIPVLLVAVGGKRQELFSPEQREESERRFRELARG